MKYSVCAGGLTTTKNSPSRRSLSTMTISNTIDVSNNNIIHGIPAVHIGSREDLEMNVKWSNRHTHTHPVSSTGRSSCLLMITSCFIYTETMIVWWAVHVLIVDYHKKGIISLTANLNQWSLSLYRTSFFELWYMWEKKSMNTFENGLKSLLKLFCVKSGCVLWRMHRVFYRQFSDVRVGKTRLWKPLHNFFAFSVWTLNSGVC